MKSLQEDRPPAADAREQDGTRPMFAPGHYGRDGAGGYEHFRLERATVMMVDDEPLNMEVIKAFLEDAGYEDFITCDQPTRVRELIESQRPDILLLDLYMPEVTGFDILAQMQADEDVRYVPVIVLTSATDADAKLKALEAGAMDFLSKPVDPTELVLRVRNTLRAKVHHDLMSFYDGLTGLPNRQTFLEHLHWAIQGADADGDRVAVLHINLDRLKQINEALGLGAGDALLKDVARRLNLGVGVSYCPETSGHCTAWRNVARLGGSEFAVIISQIDRAEDSRAVAQRVLDVAVRPARAEGRHVAATASIGIAIYPEDGNDAETLLEHASVATRHAKKLGGDRYSFYSQKMTVWSEDRLNLEADLRKALDNGELLVHYQPKVSALDGRIRGLEALMRWNHSVRGLVSPGAFIPLAEETGLILPLGEWILHEVCRQIKAWQSTDLGTVPVSVNVAVQQFREGRLANTVRGALEGNGLEPGCLTLELTESTIMENADENIDALGQLKSLGVRVSVDDFGTGYSSLSYLKRFPLDELKVDRSFVDGIPADADDSTIVATVVSMAHSLGLHVVAEGVETERQLAFLKHQGCDEYQGFLFSKPLPADEMVALMEKTKRHVRTERSLDSNAYPGIRARPGR